MDKHFHSCDGLVAASLIDRFDEIRSLQEPLRSE